jgi:hypothetical protein
MADNLTTQSATPATVPSSSVIATDDVAGVHFQRVKLVDGTADSSVAIAGDATNGLDVDVTRVQGTVTVGDGGGTLSVDDGGGSLTVDGTVAVSGSVAVTGPLTDAQLRATAVPVSGTVTITDGSGPVSVDGTVTVQDGGSTISVDDGGGSLTVDGTVGVSGTVTVDGSAVTQPVSALSLPLPTGAATSAKQPVLGTAGTPSSDVITIQGVTGGKEVPISGNVGITGTPAVTLSGSANKVVQTPATSGGLSYWRAVTAASSSNAFSLTATASQLYGLVVGNANSSPRYIHFYNTNATPTVGTTAVQLTILIPGNTAGAGLVMNFDSGIAFSNGIGYSITTEITGAAGNTTSGADLVANFFFK